MTYDEVHADPTAALDRIVERYHQVADRCDAVVVVGSDYTDVGTPTEFSYNARIAANLGAPVLLVLNGVRPEPGRAAHDDRRWRSASSRRSHGTLFAVIANRVDEPRSSSDAAAIVASAACRRYAIPEEPLLSAPSVADLMARLRRHAGQRRRGAARTARRPASWSPR